METFFALRFTDSFNRCVGTPYNLPALLLSCPGVRVDAGSRVSAWDAGGTAATAFPELRYQVAWESCLVNPETAALKGNSGKTCSLEHVV